MAGNRVVLHLGPLSSVGGQRVGLNLGVPWDAYVEPPPGEPMRGTSAAVALAWQTGAPRGRGSRMRWSAGAQRADVAAARWMAGAGAARMHRSAWGDQARLQASWRAVHASAARLKRLHGARWGSLPRVDRSRRMAWMNPDARARGVAGTWASGELRERMRGSRWFARLRERGRGMLARWGAGTRRERGIRVPWRNGRLPAWLVRTPEPPPLPPPVTPPTRGNRVGLNLGCPPARLDGNVPLNLGISACYAVRPARRVYIVSNTISVVRLPDRMPIAVESLELSASAESFCWDLQMSLADAADLQLILPGSAGPAEVEATINGYAWTFVVESYSRRRSWSDSDGLVKTVAVTGRSRTALLGAPYAPARTAVNAFDRTANQLIDAELSDTGFTAVYDALDWLVPAGAWFYEGISPLEAITRVAAASGAVVQSHPSAKALVIRPRYPASPWDWTSTAPDHVIVEDVVLDDAGSVRSAPLYDAVIVAGELAGKGVLTRVVREGSAGTLYAPQVSDQLINSVAVGAERGRNILSERGEQELIELTVPLFAAGAATGPHRVLPLQLVQVQEAGGDWIGLATAVRLSGRRENDAVVVDQILSIERHLTDAN